MEIILNPKVAYLLIFTGVMLLLIMFNDAEYSLPKVVAMAFCIVAGVAEFFILDGIPWAFLPDGEGGLAVVDAFPLDAVERKLMFGARPGVTLTVVTWFIAYLENALGIPPKQ